MIGGSPGRGASRSWRVAALLFALAAGVRFAYLAVVVGPNPEDGGWTSVTGDYRFFDETGRNLAAGNGYSLGDGTHSTAYMPPGYSLFVGAVYRVAGADPGAVRVAQALLLALVAPLTFAMAARVATPAAALVAGVLAALHPDFIYPVGRYQKENLFVPLLLVFAIAESRMARPWAEGGAGASLARRGGGGAGGGGGARAGLAAGLALAACALTRSEFLAAYVPLGAWLAWRARRGRVAPRALAALAIGALVPIAAWGARNEARLGEWIVTANGGGITLFNSTREIAATAGLAAPAPSPARTDGSWTERREDRDQYDAALAWIRAHPGACLAAAPRRLWAFWGFVPVGEVFRYGPAWTRLAGYVAYGALFPLWIAGLVRFLRERRDAGLFLALAVYFSCVAIVFTPSARIRAPLTPFLLVFAAHAIVALAQRLAPRNRSDAAGGWSMRGDDA